MAASTHHIQVLDPVTGERVRVCRGPFPSGKCPLAGPDGVVPCAGFLITKAGADPEYWPLPIPDGYRHCDVIWNERAQAGMHRADRARELWQTGLARETGRVRALAAANDPRYRKMTERELQRTALGRWRLTGEAQGLRNAVESNERQADTFLALVAFRRSANSPGTGPAARRPRRSSH